MTSANIYRRLDFEKAMNEMGYGKGEADRLFSDNATFFEINDQNIVFFRRLSALTFPDTPSVVITIKNSTLERDLETKSVSKAFGGLLAIEAADGRRLKWGSLPVPDGKAITLQNLSDVNGLKYIAEIPSASYDREVIYLRNIITVYFSLCLLGGFVLAFIFARRNYSPVNKIITMVINRLGTNNESNVFSFLESRLRMLLANYEKTKDSVQDSKRNHALRKLLKSEKSDYYENYLRQAGVDLKPGRFLLLLIRVDEYDPMFETDAERGGEILDLVFFIIQNVLGELIAQKYSAHFTEIDGDLACFVSLSSDNIVKEADNIKLVLSEGQDFIFENFKIVFSVIIGSDETKTVSRIYEETLETAEYRTVMGKKGGLVPIGASDGNGGKREGFDSAELIDLEKKLINLISVGDYDQALSVIDLLISDSTSGGPPSSIGLRNRMGRIIDIIELAAKDENPDCTVPIQKLSACKTIDSFRNELRNFFAMLDMARAGKQTKAHEKEIQRVIRYINDKYSDPSLSVAMIADELKMSTKQLARYLNEGVDMGPLDYIQYLRLEKAKTLLSTTSLTIAEIAQQIGYTNSIALNRLFKKFEGITPTQFRDH
jgi:AraC-like DNA-binding protein